MFYRHCPEVKIKTERFKDLFGNKGLLGVMAKRFNVVVCKTIIHRFESDWHLIIQKLKDMKTSFIFRYQSFLNNQIGRDDGNFKNKEMETTSKR